MKYGWYNYLKIKHYENAVNDLKGEIESAQNKDKKKARILRFVRNDYKRRIKFYKDLDKLEKL